MLTDEFIKEDIEQLENEATLIITRYGNLFEKRQYDNLSLFKAEN